MQKQYNNTSFLHHYQDPSYCFIKVKLKSSSNWCYAVTWRRHSREGGNPVGFAM